MQREKNRRIRVLYLDPEAVLSVFRLPKGKGTGYTFAKLTLPDLPEDVEVLDVQHDFLRRQFAFLLTHPSWPELPQGMMAPEIKTHFEGVRLNAYRIMPDLPRCPDPETRQRSDGTHSLVTWNDSLEEQMRRYGIMGWHADGHAIFEPGRGPSDGTIIVRPGYTGHIFKTEIVEHGMSNLSYANGSVVEFDKPITVNADEILSCKLTVSEGNEIKEVSTTVLKPTVTVEEQIVELTPWQESAFFNQPKPDNPFDKTWRDNPPLL